ncbi:hypothetical protein ACFL2K_00420 [Candidatus Margulisiibacteriota bacterium]
MSTINKINWQMKVQYAAKQEERKKRVTWDNDGEKGKNSQHNKKKKKRIKKKPVAIEELHLDENFAASPHKKDNYEAPTIHILKKAEHQKEYLPNHFNPDLILSQ